MARLPNVGGDKGKWGDILNDFLLQSHTDTGVLKAGSVDENALIDNAVTSSKFADSAVTTDKLVINAVTREKIAPNAVGGNVIADNAITSTKIEDNSVTNSKIADNSVTASKLQVSGQPLNNQVLAYTDGNLSWQTHYNTSQSAAESLANDINAANLRGGDLITNGNGALKNNYNFPSFTLNPNDAPPGSIGSFVINSTNQISSVLTEFIPYDPNKAYRYNVNARQTVAGATNRLYLLIAPYDSAKNAILPYHYMYITGTTTRLAQPVADGDTKIYLESVENWYGLPSKPANGSSQNSFRRIIFWNYIDANGKNWGMESYSRNVSAANLWDNGAVNVSDNSITLNQPWRSGALPAGHPVSNATSGGSYIYMHGLTNQLIPETWAHYSNIHMPTKPLQQAVSVTGSAEWDTALPPGTAYLKLGFLLNYPPSPANEILGRHAIANVSVMPIDRALATESWRAVPSSATASGTTGQKAYDQNYLYICTDTNKWRRIPLSNW